VNVDRISLWKICPSLYIEYRVKTTFTLKFILAIFYLRCDVMVWYFFSLNSAVCWHLCAPRTDRLLPQETACVITIRCLETARWCCHLPKRMRRARISSEFFFYSFFYLSFGFLFSDNRFRTSVPFLRNTKFVPSKKFTKAVSGQYQVAVTFHSFIYSLLEAHAAMFTQACFYVPTPNFSEHSSNTGSQHRSHRL
jgi:hypothetical protein